MIYEFLPPARDELIEAVEYYDGERAGLGDEFALEVFRAIGLILRHPLAWGRISKRARLCQTRRFPYGVIYQVRRNRILIVAVMQLSRRPGYWKGRLKGI